MGIPRSFGTPFFQNLLNSQLSCFLYIWCLPIFLWKICFYERYVHTCVTIEGFSRLLQTTEYHLSKRSRKMILVNVHLSSVNYYNWSNENNNENIINKIMIIKWDYYYCYYCYCCYYYYYLINTAKSCVPIPKRQRYLSSAITSSMFLLNMKSIA